MYSLFVPRRKVDESNPDRKKYNAIRKLYNNISKIENNHFSLYTNNHTDIIHMPICCKQDMFILCFFPLSLYIAEASRPVVNWTPELYSMTPLSGGATGE